MTEERVLIAPNSFKECASSVSVAKLIENSIHRISPGIKTELLPVSDGGDGFREVCTIKYNLRPVKFLVPSCYKGGDEITVTAGFNSEKETMYIESAEVFGLAIVPPSLRNPMNTGTGGLGVLLRHISLLKEAGLAVKQIVIGLGGSATNDYGVGAAAEFGLTFDHIQEYRHPVFPSDFMNYSKFSLPSEKLTIPITLVRDVSVPLTGKNGSASVFGKQKGADESTIKLFDEFARRFLEDIRRQSGRSFSAENNGAAGGCALGISLFAEVSFLDSDAFLFGDLGLAESIRESDVVITGEGTFDSQSLMKKATGVIISETLRAGKQLILISGRKIGNNVALPDGVRTVILEEFFQNPADSIAEFPDAIHRAIGQLGCTTKCTERKKNIVEKRSKNGIFDEKRKGRR